MDLARHCPECSRMSHCVPYSWSGQGFMQLRRLCDNTLIPKGVCALVVFIYILFLYSLADPSRNETICSVWSLSTCTFCVIAQYTAVFFLLLGSHCECDSRLSQVRMGFGIRRQSTIALDHGRSGKWLSRGTAILSLHSPTGLRVNRQQVEHDQTLLLNMYMYRHMKV